ncbi:MAG TPA: DUF4307 domain-containing protein [Glaciibacter sp.]|nr:DUF4307 domain-containing protein [Glaciibacter sp.]
MTASAQLDARYGRSANRRKRDRILLLSGAALFAIVLVAWVVWAGLDGSKPLIETEDIGYSVVDDHNVTVTFQVSVPVGTATSCAVEALNESFTVVGWKVIDLPPSDQYTRSFTEDLRTSELATTGLIYRCWLT